MPIDISQIETSLLKNVFVREERKLNYFKSETT